MLKLKNSFIRTFSPYLTQKINFLKFNKINFSFKTYPRNTQTEVSNDKYQNLEIYCKEKKSTNDLQNDNIFINRLQDIENHIIKNESIESYSSFSRLLHIYSLSKIIPNEKILDMIVFLLNNEDQFKFFSHFKQHEILKLLESLVVINLSSKHYREYYSFRNLILLYLKAYRGGSLKINKFSLLSLISALNNFECINHNLIIPILTSSNYYINLLSFRDSALILLYSAKHSIFDNEMVDKVLNRLLSFDICKNIKNDQNPIFSIKLLVNYACLFLESNKGEIHPKLKQSIDELFIFFYDKEKLTASELILYQNYYLMSGNDENFELIAKELNEIPNKITLSSLTQLLTNYELCISHKKADFRKNSNMENLMSQLVIRFQQEKLLEKVIFNESYINSLFRYLVIVSETKNKNFKVNSTVVSHFFDFNHFFNIILKYFNLTILTIKSLTLLKKDFNNVLIEIAIRYLDEFILNINKYKQVSNFYYVRNLLYFFISLDLNHLDQFKVILELFKDLQKKDHQKLKLSLEEKLSFNSLYKFLESEYSFKIDFHKINELDIRIQQKFRVEEKLIELIKKQKYAIHIEKHKIFEQIFYFDIFAPASKLGFIILDHNQRSKFELEYDVRLKMYQSIVKKLYAIDLIILDENKIMSTESKLFDLQ